MIPSPLHPAVVHFPLVLAVLLPIFAVVILAAILAGRLTRRAWILPLSLSVLLAISAFVALRTGQKEEERVERAVSENLIKQHEEAAESFLIASGILALISVAGLLGGAAGNAARIATTAGAAVVLLLGFNVGKAGGELVYKHGAAQVYVSGAAGPGAAEQGENGGEKAGAATEKGSEKGDDSD